MKVTTNTLDDFFSNMRAYFQRKTRKYAGEKPPLRSELYTRDQMEQHAKYLAGSHELSYDHAPDQLVNRLSDNEEVLERVTSLLHDAVKEKSRISPAGEWLLDNYYLIEDQIVTGKRYLPKKYSKGLPQLASGPSTGLPRVYDIALEIISHSDGHVDISSLTAFIESYQKIKYLTIGELWAVPIMLRLALLENLRRVAARIAIDRIDETIANNWADKIISAAEKDPKSLVLVISDMARTNPPVVSAFVAPFTRRLQWKGSELTMALTWLEQHLTEKGQSVNAMVLAENQKQAADQVSMSNSINSLRFLAKMDWREFVESMSIVEQTLKEDINGVYQQMDFFTRDSYRHVVEKIAKSSELSEQNIARIVVDFAKESFAENNSDLKKAHVGYYLAGNGVSKTIKAANPTLTTAEICKEVLEKHSRKLYIIGSLLITLLVAFGLFAKAQSNGVSGWLLAIVAVLALVGASQLGLSIANWVATLLVKPKQLPRLNFSKGIPFYARTLVAVPCIIADEKQAQELVDELEVRFLANRDENLLFGLLTDLKDANEEKLPGDDALVDFVKKQIEGLNVKYGRDTNDIFQLFHRPRQWNAKEKIWMGYERKRGKLTELNHLLRGNAKDRFATIVGDETAFTRVKFVITLDADTQLPRDAAWKLTGMMAHPLNQAVYSDKKGRVVDGYGIIQPRIAISLQGATRSLYARMHENDAGIDPYTRVTSDVYQDLFAEGSFIGKGIYDVDIFEKALDNRFPENRILSHDLLEGAYARCAYASDVQLYEEYPFSYSVDMGRRHRWIRGDWQIGNWFLPWVPDANRKLHKNPVSALSRWKIFDNLRRSLLPIALTALLLLGWTVLSSAWFWTISVLVLITLPSLIISAYDITRKPADVTLGNHIRSSIKITGRNIIEALFTAVCLPYEAYISLDAILRTAWRLIISHRHLLEWNPSGFAANTKRYGNLVFVYYAMWFAPFLAAAALVYVVLCHPLTLISALPFIASWALSPFVVWGLSRPLVIAKSALSVKQLTYLRTLSRKTWGFFECFVGAEDNWLPPDNHQNHPVNVTAHRTSPTNIGLALLANLTAHDFGYITTSRLIERTSNTVRTMQKLEMLNGHYYNWYDTLTLSTLHPRYISTVDSGNLAGHLLTLKQGLLALPQQPVVDRKLLEGLLDTIRVVAEQFANESGTSFSDLLVDFEETMNTCSGNPASIKECIEKLSARYTETVSLLNINLASDKNWWGRALGEQIKASLDEIKIVAPWLFFTAWPAKFAQLQNITNTFTLKSIADRSTEVDTEIAKLHALQNTDAETQWLADFVKAYDHLVQLAGERIIVMRELAAQCGEIADNMRYDFLYDSSQHLLAIGYNAEEHRRDASFYDLLASEARLSVFVAIAQGKIPQESWFTLGRRLTNAAGEAVLLSWSGSMFEYLMPNLVMPSYGNTLIDQTNRGVINRQMEYGKQNDVPWGVSESCYNMVDASLNYQYKAFGVPGLGFKRGLGDELVIAPYATIMSLMVDPEAACGNLEKMKEAGFENMFGFYEAIDYTPARLPRGQKNVLIQSFMVHHQGMGFLSLAYLLLGQPMQKRFAAEPQFQATLLLLQEQIPKVTGFFSSPVDSTTMPAESPAAEMRVIKTPDTSVPEVQLLSNGKYHVMVTNAGGGYSRWQNNSVTRWREDGTCDNWGSFCYVRDLDTGDFWSTAYHPTLKQAKSYEAVFSQGRAEFRRHDNDIETHTEIIVSPEDDIEIRRIQVTNRSGKRKRIELTSYAEVVIAPADADAAHPAFSKLFVQTEIVEKQRSIICTRRAKSKDEQPPYMFHLMRVNGVQVKQVSYETDRDKFIGRGNTAANPAAMQTPGPLQGSQGPVLDPIVAIRYVIVIEEDEMATFDLITGMTDTREICQSLIDKYQDRHLRDRAFELAWTHSQVVLRQINASEADAQLYGRIAGSVIYTNADLRAAPSILARNNRGQSSLWSYSISGDIPVVLLQISDAENISLVKQMVQAHAYWHLKGLLVDLVIWNDDHTGYRQVLQEQIQRFVAAGISTGTNNRGGIFVRPIDQISQEDRILLQTVARIIVSDAKGSLIDQISRRGAIRGSVTLLNPSTSYFPNAPEIDFPHPELTFFNGYGGFSPDGKEYIINISNQKNTPAPWVNVIANPSFGTVISESGSAYTWAENAHEFRLTPWNNDAVTDNGGEAYYIRDERSGYYWSPMPFPKRGRTPYVARHGFGYSIFEHSETGITTETTVYADIEDSIKFTIIKIRNRSGRQRRLSVTGYAEWVLGDLRPKSLMHVVTDNDGETGALYTRNTYNSEFASRIAFFDADDGIKAFTTDRTEFIGRNGSLANPDALRRLKLSDRCGAGYDPCTALQLFVDLEDGAEKELIFKMGAAEDTLKARALVKKFRGSGTAVASLQRVHAFWQGTLGAVQVETPDKALNLLANGWLLYQVISCRLWGRTGFYQSGGAFGLRDQLQDVMALVHVQPILARKQILLAASRQFKEGDGQHWWHPPLGRGVRTHVSDDFLWLPFVLGRYITVTGDVAILDEQVRFLEGRPVNANEESYYDLPNVSENKASLYDHAKAAVTHGLRFGQHGLPLMGAGDWNDGMNLVGKEGKGESVWLGFFLYDVLLNFAAVADDRADAAFAMQCREQAADLKNNLRKNAWDGNWYLRAFFDDGSPLGSKTNPECSIDAIAQSWSVISGGGDAERSKIALASLDKYLVKRDAGIIQLLDPPFNTSALEPGYIKGYLPGVRENGGQYTHAAIWSVMAFAKAGDTEKTYELLKLINPVNHGSTQEEIAVYKTEPYVMAGDVYGVQPHTGRGGWTWYTGSAGWMYQLITEWVLGLKRENHTLQFKPCLPVEWKSFNMRYRYIDTWFNITVQQQDKNGGMEITIDGKRQDDGVIRLNNDKQQHAVLVKYGPAALVPAEEAVEWAAV